MQGDGGGSEVPGVFLDFTVKRSRVGAAGSAGEHPETSVNGFGIRAVKSSCGNIEINGLRTGRGQVADIVGVQSDFQVVAGADGGVEEIADPIHQRLSLLSGQDALIHGLRFGWIGVGPGNGDIYIDVEADNPIWRGFAAHDPDQLRLRRK